METRQWRRLLIAAVAVATVTMASAGGVSAHARLTASVPADKATVTTVPPQVLLTFSEETSPTKSGGSVIDARGATVSTGFTVDLNDRTRMTIALKPNLPNGVYTVRWNSLTEEDNGAADGTFTFTIQAQAAGTAPATTTTPAVTTAATVAATPTAAATATAAPTATRAATTAVATGTGGGTAAATTAPAALPQTGNNDRASGAPLAIVILVVAAVAIASGFAFRFRSARR